MLKDRFSQNKAKVMSFIQFYFSHSIYFPHDIHWPVLIFLGYLSLHLKTESINMFQTFSSMQCHMFGPEHDQGFNIHICKCTYFYKILEKMSQSISFTRLST